MEHKLSYWVKVSVFSLDFPMYRNVTHQVLIFAPPVFFLLDDYSCCKLPNSGCVMNLAVKLILFVYVRVIH